MKQIVNRRFLSNIGFEYSLGKRTIIAQAMAISKDNVTFTDDNLKALISSITKYSDSRNNVKTSPENFVGDIYDSSLINNDIQSFCKYITKETYKNYILKGKFQLGSLRYYREIEKNESRDEKEGFSNILIETENNSIFIPVISGFNYYVLCGTSPHENKKYMSNKFGDIKITIKNVNSFANSIAKAIGASRWFIRKVDYSDFMSCRIKQRLNEKPKNGFDVNAELFNCLIENSTFPSLFVKPNRFSCENELRIIFEMPKNVKKTINIHNQGLLQYLDNSVKVQ